MVDDTFLGPLMRGSTALAQRRPIAGCGQRRALRGWAAASLVSVALLAGCERAGDNKTAGSAAASGTTASATESAAAAAPTTALSFKGVDITGADYARELNLPDATGQLRSLADFKGRVVVVFFGYTQCPDVCPTTLADLATAKRELGADGAKMQAVLVTVDPERDTPEILKAYTAAFDPSFIALRGSLEETRAVAKHFKVFYAKVPGKVDGNYTVDHTAGAYLFDKHGRVRVFTRQGTGAAALVQDLRSLIREP